MAFIGVRVPGIAASYLSQIEIPGTPISPEDMHVTILYLGKNVPIPDVLQATMASYILTKRWTPFKAATRRVTTFPENPDDGIPIVAKILCPELHRLHAALRKSLDYMEIDYSKKYPEYKPHVTLAYSKDEMADIKIPQVSWTVEELVIWGGDEGDERIAVTLPLGGDGTASNPLKDGIRL